MDYYVFTRYKVWDKVDNVMCNVLKIEDSELTITRSDFKDFSNGEYERTIHIEDEEFENVVILQSVPNNFYKDLFVGDVVKYHGDIYEIGLNSRSSINILLLVGETDKTSYNGTNINYMMIKYFEKIGNKYENPELYL